MKIEKAEIISILDQMIQKIERHLSETEFTINSFDVASNKGALMCAKLLKSQIEALPDQPE